MIVTFRHVLSLSLDRGAAGTDPETDEIARLTVP
jgi:hypothetical protein